MAQRSEELVFGTGGQVLAMLKKVMGMLTGLRTLELKDLLLEGKEGLQLLDDVRIRAQIANNYFQDYIIALRRNSLKFNISVCIHIYISNFK